MAHGILSLPGWLIGVLLVLVLPALVLLVQWGIRRRWPAMAEGQHNDVVGFIIAVVGVIYAVLLGFVVIVTWEAFNEAESIVGQEASTLRSMYRESAAFPPESREQVHDLVRQYAAEVVEAEWPAMAEAEPGDPRVGDVLDEMALVISSVPVTTPAQQEFVGAETQRLSELVALRSQRLDFADRGIPGVLWTALVVGGVVTVGFALLFGLQRAVLHSLMVGSLAALVGVLFFVTLMINYPFAGDVAVEPEPFHRVLADFGP
ncbi:bestrophin-like domain [Geodermatophilus sp. SYSU D01105]